MRRQDPVKDDPSGKISMGRNPPDGWQTLYKGELEVQARKALRTGTRSLLTNMPNGPNIHKK